MIRPNFYLVGCLLSAIGSLNASTISVSGFTQITNGVFIDFPLANQTIGNILPPFTLNGITITPSTGFTQSGGAFLNCAYAMFGPLGTPDIPGNGVGECGSAGTIPTTSITFTFSTPVAAFGATLLYDPSLLIGSSTPDLVQVFGSQNGTGPLLGSISSSGLAAGLSGHDFAGLVSTSANIQSATITGTGTNMAFIVDGIAYSLTPTATPEPSSVLLMGFGITALVLIGNRYKKAHRPIL